MISRWVPIKGRHVDAKCSVSVLDIDEPIWLYQPMDDSHDPAHPLLPDFAPVPRKNTVTHGWTVTKQRGFIEALAMTGSVRMATEAVGMSHCGVYKLRNAPGAESFVRAWEAAVALGAARIRDVLFDQAIHGIPEVVVLGKDVRIERRRFNHRTMIWALQHHMPEQYPGGSTLASRPRAPQALAEPAPEAGDNPWAKPLPTTEELSASILKKIEAVRRPRLREIAADPARRAAYELAHPNDPHDWDALLRELPPPPGRAA
jgi:hypothetical protein